MANYTLNIGSKFQPFSLERYLTPFQLYGQAYKEQEAAINELATKADVWKGLANEQTDEKTYKQYLKYANDLTNVANQLANEGLSSATRKGALDMKTRYSSEITPIEVAYNKRAEDIKRQKDIADKTGNRVVFTRNAANTSLDDYMSGVEDFGQANLDAITNEGMVGGKALSSRYLNTEEGKRFKGTYFSLINEHGLDPAKALEAMSGSDEFPEFKKYINDVYAKVGIDNFNINDQLRIQDALTQGINAGIIYDKKEDLRENWLYKYNLEHPRPSNLPTIKGIAINPINLYSVNEIQDYNNNIKAFEKYFTTDKDGNVTITQEGMDAFNAKDKVTGVEDIPSYIATGDPQVLAGTSYAAQLGNNKNAFRVFMNSLGVKPEGKVNGKNVISKKALSEAWKNYVGDRPTPEQYDATKFTEYDYRIASADAQEVKESIARASNGMSLNEVDYDRKTGSFKPTGDKLNLADFQDGDYKVLSTRFTADIDNGYTLFIQGPNGEIKRYHAPSGINFRSESNRQRSLLQAKEYATQSNSLAAQLEATIAQFGANSMQAQSIAERKAYYDSLYQMALESAYSYESQLWYANKTKDQEFNPFPF